MSPAMATRRRSRPLPAGDSDPWSMADVGGGVIRGVGVISGSGLLTNTSAVSSSGAVSPASIGVLSATLAMFRPGHSTVTESLGLSSGWLVEVMSATFG